MNRIFTPLATIALILSACSTPSLWGTYATPTASSSYTSPAASEFASPIIPTPISEPVPATATATDTAIPTVTPVVVTTRDIHPTASLPSPTPDKPPILYYSQSGDTLEAVAIHFGVAADEITASQSLPKTGLLDPNTLLVIPDRLQGYGPNTQIIPDSEVVFSVSAADFDIAAYITQAGGELANYREYLGSTGWTSGSSDIERLATENSINPRLLLAILDYEGHWVTGKPNDYLHRTYPMGYVNEYHTGVFRQMVWAVNQLYIAYYGWRDGTLTDLVFPDGTTLRLAPELNAGSVAIQYLFSKLYNQHEWLRIMDPNTGFPAKYAQQFGDPWARAQAAGPIFPTGLTQPTLVLPFESNREWAYTGGPHGAWEHDGPLAAIDFAPSTDKPGCTESEKWVVASAPGLVVRSAGGVVVLDLDGDGYEQTGWNLMYLHIATKDRVKLGTWVVMNDRIGHASCEGGVSTGTHLHFARKYNGEWVPADGPMPFTLSGYVVHAGEQAYEGTLTKGDITITANPGGTAPSVIFRAPDE